MKKRIIILSAIAVLIIIALIFSSYYKGEETESIRTTGTIKGTEVNISSKISGRISELCCGEGDTVQAGSLAVLLESDDLKAEVERANASLQRATADINTAEANLKAAEARMEEAKRQVKRLTELYKERLVSPADFDLAQTSLDSATADYKAYISRLASAKARLKEAEALLLLKEIQLKDTIITAPISGTVAYKALEAGELVSPGAVILTIVDMDNLWVRIDVEETLINYIGLGSEALVSIDSVSAKTITGNVFEIGRYAEFATQKDVRHGIQDIKTFHVKINIQGEERILKPGMTVNVEIPLIATD